jgi:acyl-CoA hydrolase
MLENRIRFKPLMEKITDPDTACLHIQNGTNVFISGFTAGYPKLIPQALVRRAEAGERFKINLFAGASTGDAVDGILARADLVDWRRPYMSNRSMREMINDERIRFKDDHLSRLSAQVRDGGWGAANVAVVEATAITEKGHLIPTMSVGNTPTYVREAEKIIIEISAEPPALEGIHDIFIPEDPPYRMPIPIYRAGDRIGKPFIDMDPAKVVAILYSQEEDSCAVFNEPGDVPRRIAQQILDFVAHEIRKDRMPPSLPWQSGVGDVANAVLSGFIENDFFQTIDIYSEVLQDAVLDLVDLGKVRAASGSAMTLSHKARTRFFNELYRYRNHIVLRPVEISNSPEVVQAPGGNRHQHRHRDRYLRTGQFHTPDGVQDDERNRRFRGFSPKWRHIFYRYTQYGQGRKDFGHCSDGFPRGPQRTFGGRGGHGTRAGGYPAPDPAAGGRSGNQAVCPSGLS